MDMDCYSVKKMSLQVILAFIEIGTFTYQSLIRLYLCDCAAHSRKLDLRWK